MSILTAVLTALGGPWMAPVWAMIGIYAFTRGRERSAFRRGSKRYREGRLAEAIVLLAKAESLWRPNEIHKTPARITADYLRLKKIISLLVRAVNENGGGIDAHELLQILDEQAGLWSDKKNRIWGTHDLKREPDGIDQRNVHRLTVLREDLRSAVSAHRSEPVIHETSLT